MYKYAINILFVFSLTLLIAFCCVKGIEGTMDIACMEPKEVQIDAIEQIGLGIPSTAVSGQRVVICNIMGNKVLGNLTEEELTILFKIVEAEAGGEDEKGKILVANVVMNRKESEAFPDSIKEVVFQKENGVTQFSPVSDGRFSKVKISEETKEAVYKALSGEDLSDGALYFAARKYADSEKMKWFDENLEFLFCHGGHDFFR